MGFSSQGGHLGFKTQTAQGTYKDPGAVSPNNGLFMKLESGAMGSDRTLVKPSPEIGGSRAMVGAELGPASYSATYKFYARMNSLASWLYWTLGAVTDSTGTRVDANCGTTTGQALVTDAAIAIADQGRPVSGAGVPPNTFVGTVIAATSFRLSSSPITQVDVTATATGAAVSLTIGATGISSHRFGTALTLPYFSIEEQLGNGYDVIDYTDCKVDSFTLMASAAAYLEAEAAVNGIHAQFGATATPLANQVWDTSPMTVGTNIKCYIGGVQIPAKDVKFEFKNNMDKSNQLLGSFELGSLDAKSIGLTTTITVRPADHGYLRQAVLGSSSATLIQGQATLSDLSIVCQTWETIGATTVPYELAIDVPVNILDPFKPTVQGDNPIENTLVLEAFQPSPTTDVLAAEIINAQAVTV